MKRIFFGSVLTAIVITLTAVVLLLGVVIADVYYARRPHRADHHRAYIKEGAYYVSDHPNMIVQRFLAVKPKGLLRIFVLGESQAMGTPYANQANVGIAGVLARRLKILNKGGISTWLEAYLKAAFPGRPVEVINAAKGAVGLAESLMTFEEIAEIGQADLVVFLAGNNERDRADLEPIGLQLAHPADVERVVKRLTLRFQGHLARIAAISEKNKIPVYFLTVPVNLKDWMPSAPDNFGAARIANLIAAGDYGRALSLLRQGGRPNALRHFYMARCHGAAGRNAEALKHYRIARDLDETFLRCRSPWNDATRNIRGPHITILDMEHIMEGYAKDGIPGFDLFHDFCHFKLRANQLVALEVALAYIRSTGRPEKDLERTRKTVLPALGAGKLRTMYALKAIQWLRNRYYSPYKDIVDLNTGNVIQAYRQNPTIDLKMLDDQIQKLKTEGPL